MRQEHGDVAKLGQEKVQNYQIKCHERPTLDIPQTLSRTSPFRKYSFGNNHGNLFLLLTLLNGYWANPLHHDKRGCLCRMESPWVNEWTVDSDTCPQMTFWDTPHINLHTYGLPLMHVIIKECTMHRDIHNQK
jgi:hypothetical protein